ncbi:bifunctional nuclease family protein [bacterium]|nr:bifunctional nuclease family protein [bacterium]
MLPAQVRMLAFDIKANTPVIVLEVGKNSIVPIWIGTAEARAIAMALAGLKPVRPMSHDLIKEIVEGLDAKLERVVITGIREDIYYALLHINQQDKTIVIDARPSDSIALALRTNSPIFVSDDIPVVEETEENKLFLELKNRLRTIRPEDIA